MKEKKITVIQGLIIILLIDALIIVTLLFLANSNRKNIIIEGYKIDDTGFTVSSNSNDYPYQYCFEDSSAEPVVYYNDKDNNATYIRICTYKYEYEPNEEFYEYDEFYEDNEIVNPEKLIDSVYYTDENKAIINLNVNCYTKHNSVRQGYLEGDINQPYTQTVYSPEDVDIYIKLNDVLCSKVELKIDKNDYIASESQPVDVQYIANNYIEFKNEYFSLCSEGKYGLLNSEGVLLIDFISEKEIEYKDDLVIINKDGLDYLADFDSNIISDGYENLEFIYSPLDPYFDYNYIIASETNTFEGCTTERIGLLNKEGELIAPIVYGSTYYLFLDVPFRCVKFEEDGNIITDLDGNKKSDTNYKYIYRLGGKKFFVGLICKGMDTRYVLLDSNGIEISKHYDRCLYSANDRIPLFQFDIQNKNQKDQKIIDKNGRERMQGIYTTDYYSDQPILEHKGDIQLIDGVDVSKFLEFQLKLISITDDEVILEQDDGKTEPRRIIIRNGELIEE